MRKRIFGRRFKRDRNERKALFKSLMHGIVIHGKIRTTEAKAKAIKGELEKLVTIAREKRENAKQLLLSRLTNEKVVERLISEIAPKFATRPGGYTRIIKIGPRIKDGAKMVLMTWVEEVGPALSKEPKRRVSKVSRETASLKLKQAKTSRSKK